MDTVTAIKQRRSIRKFQNKPVPAELLRQLVSLGRLYASGGNLQPLRFAIIAGQPLRSALFQELHWAMYLPDFEIRHDQQPQAYILLLSDRSCKRSVQFDVGAAATTIMLAAESHGLGTCCLGSFREQALSRLLRLGDAWRTELVIALGYPDQESTPVPYTDSVRYTQDAQENLFVPKYSPEEVLVCCDV